MISRELRQKFLRFFEEKGHKILPSSSLIPTDPSVLFTTAGMQQFKPYYLGEKSPFGKDVATCQKCFRTSDIDQVGDESHLTFLEMLGNFSFGGYFKEEAIKLAYEFLFKELKIPLDEAIFTVFKGDQNVPEDKESIEIWRKLGVPENKIKKLGREDNFWGPTGEEGPCGPTTEIHISSFRRNENADGDESKLLRRKFHRPQGIEVWNLVFNEYYQDKNKKLIPLKQKGVDTGMGLERLAMIVQNAPTIFETDLLEPLIKQAESMVGIAKISRLPYRPFRIIVDHIKAAVFLVSEGILPSNVERGYVLRRVLRRAIRYGKLLSLGKNFLIPLSQEVIELYQDIYPELKSRENDIIIAVQNEEEKFEKTLEEGLKKFEKGLPAFELYTSYGFPLELTIELAKEKGIKVDVEEFNRKFKEHQKISRAGAEKKFVGGMADHSEKTVKYHTAAHLMLAALREVLGPDVYQKGSNITVERLRFDFNYPQKLDEAQIKKIEDLVNQKIQEDLSVVCQETTLEEAKNRGATGVFEEKYGEEVKVYQIGEFSKEICGGPHVKKTSELGNFRIIKEESSGAGIRRIRAILE